MVIMTTERAAAKPIKCPQMNTHAHDSTRRRVTTTSNRYISGKNQKKPKFQIFFCFDQLFFCEMTWDMGDDEEMQTTLQQERCSPPPTPTSVDACLWNSNRVYGHPLTHEIERVLIVFICYRRRSPTAQLLNYQRR